MTKRLETGPEPTQPAPRGPVPSARPAPARSAVELTVDGKAVSVPVESTLLQAIAKAGINTPTLCYLETLTPINVCRVCVVEVENSRALVPACSRKVEPGMVVRTDSERVRLSRRMVLEFLASSVDVSTAPELESYLKQYDADIQRYGTRSGQAENRDHAQAGRHAPSPIGKAATAEQPVKIDNELYIRDYSKCILCYKCVQACGKEAQNTFAISVAGRGFEARISTEYALPLTDSACVYCGNCIPVCPTGALMFKSEYDLRAAGEWDESRQSVTTTICPYCGVGCNLSVHVQDDKIVKVTSPKEHQVTYGHLCIKGRFGWQFAESNEDDEEPGDQGTVD